VGKIAWFYYHIGGKFSLDCRRFVVPCLCPPNFERIGGMTILFIYANFILPLILLGIGYIAVLQFEAEGKNKQ
jgi:hypothetical protein